MQPAASPCRIEAAFKCAARHSFPRGAIPDWFVFTTPGVFWNEAGLRSELSRAEGLLLPATPKHDVLLVGGGGLMTFREFMIFSRPAINLLADSTYLASCSSRLSACDPSSRSGGCKFRNERRDRGGSTYTPNELVHYCLRAPLGAGRCGAKKSGCEWVFGRLTSQSGPSDGATAARRRFVSNAAGKGPQGAVKGLLVELKKHQGGSSAPSGSVDTPCALAGALRGLVAFGNANSEAMRWLSETRDRSRTCPSPSKFLI